MNSINWSASSIWVFIAQLGEHCSTNVEATGSNPVEAPKKLFSGYFRNCLNCDSLRWSHTHFIRSLNPFPVVWLKMWQNFCETGIMETVFFYTGRFLKQLCYVKSQTNVLLLTRNRSSIGEWSFHKILSIKMSGTETWGPWSYYTMGYLTRYCCDKSPTPVLN